MVGCNPNFCLWLGALFYCGSVQAAVYGEDNRADVSLEESREIREVIGSVAILVPQSQILQNPFGRSTLFTTPVKTRYNLCSSDQFSDQPSVGICSAFLATDDTVVTAGHCVPNANACRETAFVFDFDATKIDSTPNSESVSIDSSSIFHCREIISRASDSGRGNDFAIIRLDRSTNRQPLQLRQLGQAPRSMPVTAFGFPNGSLLKITSGANIRENATDKSYLVTNVDGFPGNSGSVILGPEYQVEGILVRGEKAYTNDPAAGCTRVVKCGNNACRGEDVVKTESFIHLIPREGPKLILKETRIVETAGNGNGVLEPGEEGSLKLTIENTGTAPAYNIRTLVKSLTADVAISNNENAIPNLQPMATTELDAHIVQVGSSVGCSETVMFELVADTDGQIFAHKGRIQLGTSNFTTYAITPDMVLKPYLPGGQEFFIDLPEGAHNRKVSFGVEIEHSHPEEIILSVRSPGLEYSSILFLHGRSQQAFFARGDVSARPLNGTYGVDNEPYESISHFSQVTKRGLWSFNVRDLAFGNAATVKKLSVLFENRVCQ
jgi:V8-like Glu-specific endopeptidase